MALPFVFVGFYSCSGDQFLLCDVTRLGQECDPQPLFSRCFVCLSFVPRGPVNFETENSEVKMSCPPGTNHLFPIAARIACTFSTLVTRCVEPRVVRSRHATLALP